jgi:hypothetical protein
MIILLTQPLLLQQIPGTTEEIPSSVVCREQVSRQLSAKETDGIPVLPMQK